MSSVRYMALTVAALLFGSSNWAMSSNYPIEVEAMLAKCSPESAVLAMKVRNVSQRTIELYRSDLPWGIKSSLVMAIVTNTPDPEMIEPANYIDDPRPGLISIEPGREVEGSIDLRHRFPRLLQRLQKQDLLVFWSYQALSKDGVPTSRQGGSVLVERVQCNKSAR